LSEVTLAFYSFEQFSEAKELAQQRRLQPTKIFTASTTNEVIQKDSLL